MVAYGYTRDYPIRSTYTVFARNANRESRKQVTLSEFRGIGQYMPGLRDPVALIMSALFPYPGPVFYLLWERGRKWCDARDRNISRIALILIANEIAAPLFVEAATSQPIKLWGISPPCQRRPPGYPILPCNTACKQLSPIFPYTVVL